MLTGAGLVALLWLLAAVVAFVIFDRESPAVLIIGVTLSLFVIVVVLLAQQGLVDIETGAYAVLVIALLVGLYVVPLRGSLPQEARELNRELSGEYQNRYQYADALFWRIAGMFTGPTREYLLQPLRIFVIKNPGYFWETRGYMPSHLQAQLLRLLLLDSGRFEPHEVEYQTGRCFNSPHGYLLIHHPEQRIYADLWAAANFKEYRFGQLVDMPSCDDISSEGEPRGEPYKPGGKGGG